MTVKAPQTTLDDVARSINFLRVQISGMETQMNSMDKRMSSMEERMGGLDGRMGNLEMRMATKDDLNKLGTRLETTIKREAGDLGESIALLTNMVAKEFDGLAITRLKA